MYVGLTTNPFPSAGAFPWWRQAYTLPDVGLNHPARWQWNGTTQTVSFNPPDSSSATPQDLPFYQMKGFFITRYGDPLTGPNTNVANAGDQLQLTTRVYNFSPVDTDHPTLKTPYKKIWLSIFGQQYDPQRAALVGDSFLIGSQTLNKIPGFHPDSNTPNWVLVSLPNAFDTSDYAGKYLLFWVVTWMDDGTGNLAPELPDRGLSGNPANMYYKHTTDVPVEPYSNNIGLYGVFSPFYIAPKPALGAPEEPVKIAYYDGDPNKGGVLLGYQQLPYIAPFSNYLARDYYQPSSCGEHSPYVVASTPGATPTTGFTTTQVTIDPASAIQNLSSSVTSANLPAGLTRRLKWLLTIANYFFSQQDNRAGVLALRFFDQLVKSERGKAIEQQEADKLIGQVREMTSCLRTVNAHTIAPALTTLLSDGELQFLIQRSHLQKP